MIICGKYEGGKTHLLNTVFNMASENNMVVSYLSLNKETPIDKLYMLYPKLMVNTYLPRRLQPGFMQVLCATYDRREQACLRDDGLCCGAS